MDPEFSRVGPNKGPSHLSIFVYPWRRKTAMNVLVVYISGIVILGGAACGLCWIGEKLDKMLHGSH